MSDEDSSEMNRRELLRKSTVATVTGLGVAHAATGSASASMGLSELKAEGVVLTNRDAGVSTDIRTGQRLLGKLAADGLLEDASLDALPDERFDDDGQIHRTFTDGQKEIAFTTSTPKGRLQVTFGEDAIPSAALFPEDGGAVVMYTAPDGETYQHYESDLEVSSNDDVSPDCSDYSCDGCACETDWCFFSRYKYKCMSCDDGECIITSSCGC